MRGLIPSLSCRLKLNTPTPLEFGSRHGILTLNIRPKRRSTPTAQPSVTARASYSFRVQLTYDPSRVSVAIAPVIRKRKMAEREYLGGTPQPTTQERNWAIRLAPILVEMARKHSDSRDEIEPQIAREPYCSTAYVNK